MLLEDLKLCWVKLEMRVQQELLSSLLNRLLVLLLMAVLNPALLAPLLLAAAMKVPPECVSLAGDLPLSF